MVGDYLAAMGGRKDRLLVRVSPGFGGDERRCRTDGRLSASRPSPGAPGLRESLGPAGEDSSGKE